MAETEFNALMPHTVTRNAYASVSGYGAPSYSTATQSYRALVTYEPKLVRAMDGTEKVSSANAILNCTAAVNAQDKYTLPDGSVPPVLNLTRYSDDVGQHNVRIYFG